MYRQIVKQVDIDINILYSEKVTAAGVLSGISKIAPFFQQSWVLKNTFRTDCFDSVAWILTEVCRVVQRLPFRNFISKLFIRLFYKILVSKNFRRTDVKF